MRHKDDPYVMYILEEVAKQGISEALWKAYAEMTKEVRHGQRSLYLVAHLPTDVPVDVLTMASGVFQFAGSSPDSQRRLRELVPSFHGVRREEFMQLQDREALGGFQWCTNGLYLRDAHYSFRASCIEAGGETMTREMRR
jgi:hypothetical protein